MDGSPSAARWYIAVLVLRAEVMDAPADAALLDHQVRLVRAADAEAAYASALVLGGREEHAYRNADGEEVRRRFAGLSDLDEVLADSLDDGVEVYSWRSRGAPAEAVVRKEELAIFTSAARVDRTAAELLD